MSFLCNMACKPGPQEELQPSVSSDSGEQQLDAGGSEALLAQLAVDAEVEKRAVERIRQKNSLADANARRLRFHTLKARFHR